MPRASATVMVMFLITLHVTLFYAGVEGVRAQKSGSNPHQAFYENASGDQLQDTVRRSNQSSILPDTFRISQQALSGKNVVAGLLTSPYSVFDNMDLPALFSTLGKALLGFLEAWVMLLFVRGVSG